MVFKIFVYNNNIGGSKKNILFNGLNTNSNVSICDNLDECDYIFLDFRDFNNNLDDRYLKKVIAIDYTDNPVHLSWRRNCYKYFKRSVVNKDTLNFFQYERDVIPISYCIKNECLSFTDLDKYDRNIDVSIFFNPSNNSYRERISKFIKEKFNHLNIHVGVIGYDGEIGRNTIQEPYYNTMFHSKIVVNCNPDYWEGDYRLFESLSSKALVMSDRMITPLTNPFIDKKHIVYYDRNNLNQLEEYINYYLLNDELRKEIAENGYNHAIKYHKASDRINEILQI
jgi:hypothetical protein